MFRAKWALRRTKTCRAGMHGLDKSFRDLSSEVLKLLCPTKWLNFRGVEIPLHYIGRAIPAFFFDRWVLYHGRYPHREVSLISESQRKDQVHQVDMSTRAMLKVILYRSLNVWRIEKVKLLTPTTPETSKNTACLSLTCFPRWVTCWKPSLYKRPFEAFVTRIGQSPVNKKDIQSVISGQKDFIKVVGKSHCSSKNHFLKIGSSFPPNSSGINMSTTSLKHIETP